MRTTAGIHTQPGDTPTANLRTLGDDTYLDVNLAGHPEADATLYINDPAYLAALLDVLSVHAAAWKVMRDEAALDEPLADLEIELLRGEAGAS